jgi:hypothetical protein
MQKVDSAAGSSLIDRTIGHGLCVLFIGLIAGLPLAFALLEAVTLWPLPVWKVQIPGSARGWSAAHVGGILNGVMICGIAMLAARLAVQGRALAWVCWGMIATGWCNTVFYWAGNLASNRGLSVADTPHGKGDLWGAVAYLFGGGGMVFTLIAVAILARAAFANARMPNRPS